MTDIVERLRAAKDHIALNAGMPYALLVLEAADEIERLHSSAPIEQKLEEIAQEVKTMHRRIMNLGI